NSGLMSCSKLSVGAGVLIALLPSLLVPHSLPHSLPTTHDTLCKMRWSVVHPEVGLGRRHAGHSGVESIDQSVGKAAGLWSTNRMGRGVDSQCAATGGALCPSD